MDDMQWLEGLYRSNYRMLCRVALTFLGRDTQRRGSIEDEIHEVFVLALKKRRQLQNHPNPQGWLVETLRRRLLSQYRKFAREKKHAGFSLDAAEAAPRAARQESLQTPPKDFQVLADKERRELLEAWLGKENAAIFFLYCVEGQPAAQVAKAYGLTVECLYMRVSRAKRKLLAHPELFSAFALWFLLGF